MKITITQSHIDRGEVFEAVIKGLESLGKRRAGSVSGCPVAIAINEQIPTCEAIVVGPVAVLYTLVERTPFLIKLPETARLFVLAFDIFQQSGHRAPQLKPFQFDLQVPLELLATEPSRPPRVFEFEFQI